MGLTLQRKLLMGVAGLGVGALLIDRAFFAPSDGPPPAPPGAGARAAPGAPAPAPSAPSAAASRARGSDAQFAYVRERLDTISDDLVGPVADGFTPPASWGVEAPTPREAARSSAPATPTVRLTGVLLGETPAALIDGRLVQVGDSVGPSGMRLVEVTARSAVFDTGGVRLEVRLPEPLNTRASAADPSARADGR